MIGALLLSAAAALPAGEAGGHAVGLDRLGLDGGARAAITAPEVTLPFFARRDRVLVSVRLDLTLARGVAAEAGITGLEVSVNEDLIATFDAETLHARDELQLEIEPHLVVEENRLRLRIEGARRQDCPEQLVPGAWSFIAGGELLTESTGLPLPDDLSLLPLPFWDPRVDEAADVAIAFPSAPSQDSLHAAGLIAAYFGLATGGRVRFTVHVGELPRQSAIVVATRAQLGAFESQLAAEGPAIRFVDHPSSPGTNRKLLLVSGGDGGDLVSAAAHLAAGTKLVEGPLQAFDGAPAVAPLGAYEAPRWEKSGPVYLFAPKGDEVFVHRGFGGGAIRTTFRLSPDLFVWPADHVRLDLGYAVELPEGARPKLTLQINGEFLGLLEVPQRATPAVLMEEKLRIPRAHLRGFNELVLHVDYGARSSSCGGDDDDDDDADAQAEVAISRETVLRLDEAVHFIELPDLNLFVYDGYPFSRVADLADTVFVLPDDPAPGEIRSVLSAFAHLAAVTGAPGLRATVVKASAFDPLLHGDRDLLLVGAEGRNPIAQRWSRRLPFSLADRADRVRRPEHSNRLSEVLQGRRVSDELAGARAVLTKRLALAAVLATESPLSRGRTAIVVTASSDAAMPEVQDLQGHAESSAAGGDLLLVAGERRWMFAIGPRYHAGEIDRWTSLRWSLARHWLALFPLAAIGCLAAARVARRKLDRREQQRLKR